MVTRLYDRFRENFYLLKGKNKVAMPSQVSPY